MSKLYFYVVDRDFGFAPNPFHGCCTLATCKPRIRSVATADDWVIGMGGKRLQATGCCIYAMKVSEKVTFNEYWERPEHFDKRPIRNGSKKMLVGDNIYRYDADRGEWEQADSHHSNPDGSANLDNLRLDTKTDCVLISHYFYYFGKEAPAVPSHLLNSLGYVNGINHRTFPLSEGTAFLEWLESTFGNSRNQVISEPFDFVGGEKRFSAATHKVS